jgi:hypothetical protein
MRGDFMKNILFLTFAVLISGTPIAPSAVKSVFVKDNEIFVATDGSQPQQITRDGIGKFLPLWSKDGSKIAFNQVIDAKRGLGELVVIDERGHQINDVLLRPPDAAPPEGLRYVESMEWLSEDRIAISGTQNISVIETVVVDLTSGKEAVDIVNNGGKEPVFSRDGLHFAYLDGTPHFSPQQSWRPTLNIDDKPVFPKAGHRVTFLSRPQWSGGSDKLAILAKDYQTKKSSVVRSGILPQKCRRSRWIMSRMIKLICFGTKPTCSSNPAIALGAWINGAVVEVPREAAISPLDQAKLDAKRSEAMVHEAGGGNDADFWCQSCSLAALPRKASINK